MIKKECPICLEPSRATNGRYIHRACVTKIDPGKVAPLAIAEKSLVMCHKNFICYDDPTEIINQIVDYFYDDNEAMGLIKKYIELMNLLGKRYKNEQLLIPSYLAELKLYYPLIATLCEISEINRIFAHKINNKCIHGIDCIDPHAAMGNIDLLTARTMRNNDEKGLQLLLELYKLHGEIDIADAIKNRFNLLKTNYETESKNI